MSEPQIPQLADNPLYLSRSEIARADKPPACTNSLGAVAHSRFPGSTSRNEMMQGILDQDSSLVEGHLGTVYYKPVTVCGVDLKLEPLQPSIGTAVHGLDIATDLDNRAVLHSASGDFWPHRRLMERLTILDFDVSRRTPYYKPH